jgi:hypothetical protein
MQRTARADDGHRPPYAIKGVGDWGWKVAAARSADVRRDGVGVDGRSAVGELTECGKEFIVGAQGIKTVSYVVRQTSRL